MISKRFSAPIGTGLRKLCVAPAAVESVKGTGRGITVITANPAMTRQFKEWLPQATYIQPLAWLHRASDESSDLIIVDELQDVQMRRIKATLENIESEVWLINPHEISAAAPISINETYCIN